MVSIKANCIDSTAAPEQVFAREVQKLKEEKVKPKEQLTLEPFERGQYRLFHYTRYMWLLTLCYRSLYCDWEV